MTRTMYDSTNVQDDPAGAQLVAYYIDGIYATSVAPVIARFPNAILVPISAIGTNAGLVGDVEPGCMSIGQAVEWVKMRRAAGVDPSLYVNETYGWGPARQAFQSAGIPEPHWWVADYDGIAVVPAGAVAKQYENPPMDGGHFDLSVVADFWPGVDGLFSGGIGSLEGELDMATADQILAAVTIMPARPASVVGHTDADLTNIANTSTWAAINAQFGADGEAYIYALVHPESRQSIAQAIQVLAKANPTPVDLGTLQGDVAAIKAEEDAIKAQASAIEANLNAPRPPA